MYDAVRGTNKTIASSTTNAESSDDAAGFSAFTSDGFTLRSLTTAQGTQNTLNQSYNMADKKEFKSVKVKVK